MPSTVLAKSKAQVPFLSSKLSNIRGLDSLGLQITSESTYSLLLPGLTNVTNRIRYYGFYCWLLDRYAQLVGDVDPKRQQDFVRRAELLVALVIRIESDKPLHIPGSEFADYMIAAHDGTDYRLDKGADSRPGGNPNTYWKARLGALGQYYAGSLRALGLVGTSAHNDQVLVRTNQRPEWLTGQELAAAFAEGIPNGVQELFLSCIKSGRLASADVKPLASYFDLSRVKPDSLEQAAYLRLLMAPDYPALESDAPATHRNTSLRLALAYLHENEQHNLTDFLFDNYVAIGRGNEEVTRRGWYFYQLNEYWQFAGSSVLAAVLRTLDAESGRYAHIPTFLNDFAHQVLTRLHQLLPDLPDESSLGEFLLAIDEAGLDEQDFVASYLEAYTNKVPAAQAAAALALVGKIYQRNYVHLPELREYAHSHGLLREGNFLNYAEQLTNKLAWPLYQFIYHFLHHDVVVRHQYVAMRKMGGGQQSTLKFEVEGEWFRCLDTVQARFSAPRLNVLLEMAIDLGLVTKDYALTARGQALLT